MQSEGAAGLNAFSMASAVVDSMGLRIGTARR